MAERTQVILLTGFLGSGKTTLLNRLIKTAPRELKTLILMNEFGELGVDGLAVQGLTRGPDLDMIEINRGSIFCACVKSDFIKALLDIHHRLQPDLLIIEATGVADPRDLRRNLALPFFEDRFQPAEQFCLIDAVNFLDVFQTFVSIEEQLKTSTRFIINKTDLVTPAEVAAIVRILAEHHPQPVYETGSFAPLPAAWLAELPLEAAGPTPAPAGPLEAATVEAAVQFALADPLAQAEPPDRLASAVYAWQGGPAEDLEALAREWPEEIIRVKGFVSLAGRIHLFSRALKHQELSPFEGPGDLGGAVNRLVFIAHPQALDRLADRYRDDPRLQLQSGLDRISEILIGGLT